jgi:hypothetical protein
MRCAEVRLNLAAFVAGGLAPSEPRPQCPERDSELPR